MQKRIDITENIYLLVGDSREVLKTLPEKSVQCGVTSPPYYGPRDYGTDGVLWGGDPACIHVWKEVYPPGHRSSDTNPGPLQHSGNIGREKVVSKLCTVCGAWLGEIGHEPTPEMYVAHLIEIFREFKRVLRDDGIFWLNIGDSYDDDMNLMEIPSMLAAAMKADGWYERSRLPWLKRNSFPGSTKSRPQSSIEYVFLFSKSCDTLFWVHPDKDAVYEKPEPDYRWLDRTNEEILTEAPYAWEDQILIDSNGEVVFNKSGEPKKRYKRFNLWSGRNYYYDYEAVMQYSSESYNKDKRPRGVIRQCVNKNSKYPDEGQFKKQDNVGNNTYTGFNARYKPNEFGLRFMRDSDFFFRTWQGLLHNEEGEPMALIVNPKGYKGAHFAAFPVKLVEPMIIAGSRPNDIVLDMFGGSCTTGAACLIHGRKFIGIDVKEEYCELGKKRIEDEIKRLKEVDDANRSREEKIPEPVQGNDGSAPGRDAETGGRRESAQQPIAEEAGLPGPEVQDHNGATPGKTDGSTEEATKPVAKRKRKEETGQGIDIHPARPHTRTVADRLQGLSEVSLRDNSGSLQRNEPNLTLLEMRTEGNDTDNPGTGMEVLPTVRRGDDQT